MFRPGDWVSIGRSLGRLGRVLSRGAAVVGAGVSDRVAGAGGAEKFLAAGGGGRDGEAGRVASVAGSAASASRHAMLIRPGDNSGTGTPTTRSPCASADSGTRAIPSPCAAMVTSRPGYPASKGIRNRVPACAAARSSCRRSPDLGPVEEMLDVHRTCYETDRRAAQLTGFRAPARCRRASASPVQRRARGGSRSNWSSTRTAMWSTMSSTVSGLL